MKKNIEIASVAEMQNMFLCFWDDIDVAYVKNEIVGDDEVWKIYSSDGIELATAENRDIAFVIARQNNFEPKSVH